MNIAASRKIARSAAAFSYWHYKAQRTGTRESRARSFVESIRYSSGDFLNIHPFLAVTDRVNSKVLVIEGGYNDTQFRRVRMSSTAVLTSASLPLADLKMGAAVKLMIIKLRPTLGWKLCRRPEFQKRSFKWSCRMVLIR